MNQSFIKGNSAIVEAAIDAGCRFYAGYPITPQNEIPEIMSKRMRDEGGVYLQAESELISINMVFGAAVTGARAMTTSSSPGLSLMMEGISYIAACELPVVLVNVMRGGPGLGSIAPSQADYFQSVKPGHGDFRMITLAPSTIQEMYDFTYDAFDLADKYRTPVMILTDGLLGQVMENVNIKRKSRSEYLNHPKPWALTGAKGRKGQRIASLLMKQGELEAHNFRLFKKYDEITTNEKKWELYPGSSSVYENLIIAFGTTARIAKGAIELLGDNKTALFRPKTLWPYPYGELKLSAESVKKVFVFEMNMGQMLEDVKIALSGTDAEIIFYGRPGGGVPTDEELFEFIKARL